MGKKKRDYVEKHKQSLGDVLENPETYGVRVSEHRLRCCVGGCPLNTTWEEPSMALRWLQGGGIGRRQLRIPC